MRRRAIRQVLGDELGRLVRRGIVYVDDAEERVVLVENRFEVPSAPPGIVERRYDDHKGLRHLRQPRCVVPNTRSSRLEAIESWPGQSPKGGPPISPYHRVFARIRAARPTGGANVQIHMTTFAARRRHYIRGTLQS